MSKPASTVRFNAPVIPQMRSTDVTQKFLLEQSVLRLYSHPLAKIQLLGLMFTNQLLPLILQRVLGGFKRRRVLEVNCGYGFYTQLMSMMYTQAQLIGIDNNYRKIAIAAESSATQPNVRFCHSETRYLNDLAKKPVDLILFHVSPVILAAHSQTDALTSLKQALKKIQPWLAPGGDLIFMLEHPWLFRTKQLLNVFRPSSINDLLSGHRNLASFFSAKPVDAPILSHLTELLGLRSLPTFQNDAQVSYQLLHMENPLDASFLEKMFNEKTAEDTQTKHLPARPTVPQTAARQQGLAQSIAFTGKIQPKHSQPSRPTQGIQQLPVNEQQKLKAQAQAVRQQLGQQLQQSKRRPVESQENLPVNRNYQKQLPPPPQQDEDTLGFIFSRKWGNFAQELGQ